MRRVCLVSICLAATGSALAEFSYSPYVGESYPRAVFWGDTHLHTNHSIDAYYFGDRLDLEAAYRLARGGTVTASNGMSVKLRRPLDFLVVADTPSPWGYFKASKRRTPCC